MFPFKDVLTPNTSFSFLCVSKSFLAHCEWPQNFHFISRVLLGRSSERSLSDASGTSLNAAQESRALLYLRSGLR
ncbi:hypothetical protein EYF80_043119 [Liparis tanakae]|uniref:Uncharacterized protein n=1 Tax=Liparis tanakae TaxID=230148 RepID=A0A4Z2G0G9_9TELE|nr:hypothetical protein EYF80_043119 [Liparis tanakae]